MTPTTVITTRLGPNARHRTGSQGSLHAKSVWSFSTFYCFYGTMTPGTHEYGVRAVILTAYQISQHRLTDNYTYGFRLLCSIQLLWLVYIIIPGLGPSLDRRGCALCIFSVFTIQAAKNIKRHMNE